MHDKQVEIQQSPQSQLSTFAGGVDSRHAFLNMRDLEVKASPHTRAGRTCPPAMGFSFAAGTTDGAASGPLTSRCSLLQVYAWLDGALM